MLMNLTGWQTLTLLADGLGNRQRSYSSISWTLPFSTALSFLPLVVQNYHTDSSDVRMLMRDLIQEAGRVPWPQTTSRRRQAPSTSQIQRLDLRHNRHWLMQCKRIRCRVCSAKNKEIITKYKCWDYNIGLCTTPCFEEYHTKLHFWEPIDTKMEKRNMQL